MCTQYKNNKILARKHAQIFKTERKKSGTNLNKFILKLKPVLTLFSGIMSNQNTGCSGSAILHAAEKNFTHR